MHPIEIFGESNIWHVKVLLVVNTTVEMYESDRVLQQFEFRQQISVAPQDLDDLHPIDLQGRIDENRLIFHAQYINMWNNMYEFLPTSEVIVVPELAYDPKYIQWFRVYGKLYLLGEEARSRQPHTRRSRQAPIHPRSSEVGPLSAPTQEPTPIAAPPLSQFVSSYSGFVFGPLSLVYYMLMPSIFSTTTMPTTTYGPSMIRAPTESPIAMSSMYGTQYSYTSIPMVPQIPPGSLFYQGGSFTQPHIPRQEDARVTKEQSVVINHK
ncbi:uncharacterized protein LOC108457127 [Gossypium arboreum]|uniref:Uncharacterized protein n=1 Tax=Gossypium arboreum TaxID=29729 RepID=A0ABR0QMV8_GOSAR|nr:uncharacterized protein LOC108457127 [Gossypium arboreum]KAK5840366.1 hypothetical protein PVK06_009263 [Gossypium arboreum]